MVLKSQFKDLYARETHSKGHYKHKILLVPFIKVAKITTYSTCQ